MHRFKVSMEMEMEIDVFQYIPERSSPECRNPSNINFSDDGDKEEIDYDIFIVMGNRRIEIPLTQGFDTRVREIIKAEYEKEAE